jgi:LAO/AO transport system ATPase
MATRGSYGGLATTTDEVADLLAAAGFERILIETVGVGQTELDVARTAETTALLLVPESGDGVQTLKAGVMEIADVYVINKSDRPGADKVRHEVEAMLDIRRGNVKAGRREGGKAAASHASSRPPAVPPSWEPPVLATVAIQGTGVAELVDVLDRHYAYLEASGALATRRRERLRARMRSVAARTVRPWAWDATRADELLDDRLDDVADGRRSPYDVAAEILEQLKSGALMSDNGRNPVYAGGPVRLQLRPSPGYPGAYPPAASTRPCTAAGSGLCGSLPGSDPPRTRTAATSSAGATTGCRLRSISHADGLRLDHLARKAKWGSAASRSRRSRTWKTCFGDPPRPGLDLDDHQRAAAILFCF